MQTPDPQLESDTCFGSGLAPFEEHITKIEISGLNHYIILILNSHVYGASVVYGTESEEILLRRRNQSMMCFRYIEIRTSE